MKYLPKSAAAVILLMATAYSFTAVAQPSYDLPESQVFTTDNFRFHIETGYKGQAGMENYVQHYYDDDSKRDIYLKASTPALMYERCSTVYDFSRTENPSPCGKIVSHLN